MLRKFLAVLSLLLCCAVLFGCAEEGSTRRKKKKTTEDEGTTTTSCEPAEPEEPETDPELERFASMSEQEIETEIFEPAVELYGMFHGLGSPDCDWETEYTFNDMSYFKALADQSWVDSSLDFSKYEDFKAYVCTLFSERMAAKLLDTPMYINVDGDLYCMPAGRGGNMMYVSHRYAVTQVRENEVIYTVYVDYIKDEYFDQMMDDPDFEVTPDKVTTNEIVYHRIRENGRWVFDNFELWY